LIIRIIGGKINDGIEKSGSFLDFRRELIVTWYRLKVKIFKYIKLF